MKRYCDLPYHAFPPFTGVTVVCPRCGGAGTVCLEREQHRAVFCCGSCHFKSQAPADGDHTLAVTGQCAASGRYFRVYVPAKKVRGPRVRVKCPWCGGFVLGEVSAPKEPPPLVLGEVRQGRDPYFGYPLYFRGEFRGKLVWALNREHLQYLIDYLSADLRAAPAGHLEGSGMRSQSDRLPAYMKSAKNRAGIVKLLSRMQQQWDSRSR